MSECEHKPKVVEWGFDGFQNWIPVLYGCLECDATFVQLPPSKEDEPHSHPEYVDGCFACKIVTLELGTGDANSNKMMTSKKWDGELQSFRDAHRQGIKPAGTSAKLIEDALKASDNLGSAYNAESMMPAQGFTKSKVKALQAIGA